MCVSVLVCLCVCVYSCVCVFCAPVRIVCMCGRMRVYACVSACTWVCAHICVCACVCPWGGGQCQVENPLQHLANQQIPKSGPRSFLKPSVLGTEGKNSSGEKDNTAEVYTFVPVANFGDLNVVSLAGAFLIESTIHRSSVNKPLSGKETGSPWPEGGRRPPRVAAGRDPRLPARLTVPLSAVLTDTRCGVGLKTFSSSASKPPS